MARKVRTHVPELSTAPVDSPGLTPKHLTKQAFGRRLYSLMLSHGWHQSELSRRSDIARDLISSYVRGIRFPTPINLNKLAQALSVPTSHLLPNQLETAIDADHPAFEVKVSDAAPGTAWLRVNRLVSLATALKVGELLQADRGHVDGA